MSRQGRPRWARPRLLLPGAIVLMLALAPGVAHAHPLGNFTVNSYSGLRVQPRAVQIDLVVDSAEIPTVQEFPAVNSAQGVSSAQTDSYAAAECARLRPSLRLNLGGARQPLSVRSSNLRLLPGQGALHTMRLTCQLRTTDPVGTAGQTLTYVDTNSLQRTGWREITAAGDGVGLVGSTVGSRSQSDQLTDYPQDLLSSPLDERSATMQVTIGDGTLGADAAPAAAVPDDASAVGGLTQAFTDLVSARKLGLGFALVALLISVGLGALHAFAPGHGKTLMAAYLLGQHHSLRQVAIIGLTVTLTHTAGVLVLGVALSGLAIAAPERIYGWLGVASGVLLLGIGGSLLRHARRRSTTPPRQDRVGQLVAAGAGHASSTPEDFQPPTHHDVHGLAHDHRHGHDHAAERAVTHSHGWGTHTHPPVATSARRMVPVGFAGGMVPSPSALIVLLSGIALGRAWFGVLLVVGYGIGMALALVGTGLALAHARDRIERWATFHRHPGQQPSLLLRAVHALPTTTATLVMVVGISLALRAALTL